MTLENYSNEKRKINQQSHDTYFFYTPVACKSRGRRIEFFGETRAESMQQTYNPTVGRVSARYKFAGYEA